MAIWPNFLRRKSKRVPSSKVDEMHEGGPGRPVNAPEMTIMAGPERRRSKKDSSRKRKSSKDSKKLQRDPERQRTYSFSPGRNDSIRVPRDGNRPPVPRIPSIIKRGGRSATAKAEGNPAGTAPLRASTQPVDEKSDWQRVPTLTKRKSSRKRKAEQEREEEIKAMLYTMPKRPATDMYASGRPLKRESKRMRDGLKRNLQNRSSDISLPTADSIHSSLSGDERHASYKLSGLGLLAPRPTIRYAASPHYVPGASGYGSDDSGKRKVSGRLSIPEETLKMNKRVEDLADNLNAGELRQLMDRDQKRREKKKIADKIKMEKKIARKQEKQREDADNALQNGTPPPANMERGVLGRDVVGLGIESGNSAVFTSSKRRQSDGSQRGKRPAEVFRQDSTMTDSSATGFQRSPSLRTPSVERPEPLIEVAKIGTVSRASMSPPASPKTRGHNRGASSISQMMDLSKAAESVATPEAAQPGPSKTMPIPIPARKPSPATDEQGNHKLGGSWTSFFRRNPRPKRGSTPSSFSNTSRDSMQSGPPPPVTTTGYTPMRSASNLPKRTMSKFREDLPELPKSPPDSRIQSPEVEAVPAIPGQPEKSASQPIVDPRVRYDTPTSGLRSATRDETPISQRSAVAPSPEPVALMSQSLASIDSEGSWLSGRRGGSKRSSSNLPPQRLRESASSLDKKYREYSESADEEVGIAEDEYFSRLTPGPEEEFKITQRQSKTMPSSDDEEGGSLASPATESSKWGAVARTPTVVHRSPRAKSREGLLNDYEDYDSDGEELAPPAKRKSLGFNRDLMEDETSSVRRATSVDLGKNHVRRVSAGSARLLDLKKSSDGKRMSSG